MKMGDFRSPWPLPGNQAGEPYFCLCAGVLPLGRLNILPNCHRSGECLSSPVTLTVPGHQQYVGTALQPTCRASILVTQQPSGADRCASNFVR